MLHRVAAHQLRQDLQAFIELGRSDPCIGAVAERRVVGQACVSRADTQDDSPVPEVVECDDFARELGDVSPRHGGDKRPQPDALGPDRHRHQSNPRIRRGVDDLEIIPDEEPVPARLFGLISEFSQELGVPAMSKFGV